MRTYAAFLDTILLIFPTFMQHMVRQLDAANAMIMFEFAVFVLLTRSTVVLIKKYATVLQPLSLSSQCGVRSGIISRAFCQQQRRQQPSIPIIRYLLSVRKKRDTIHEHTEE